MKCTCVLVASLFFSLGQLIFNPVGGQCVRRGMCKGEHGKAACVYEGPPVPLKNRYLQEHNTTELGLFKTTCPQLAVGSIPAVCCDIDNIIEQKLYQELAKSAGFARCPSCFYNIQTLSCYSACSPKQKSFLKINRWESFEDGPPVSQEATLYLSKKFAYDMFESCKGVKGFLPGTYVMDYGACGRWSRKQCNPERWFEYMGTPEIERGPADSKVNFRLTINTTFEEEGEIFYTLNPKVASCSESPAPGLGPCSCSDCDAACSAEAQAPPLPSEPKPFVILGYHGFNAIAVIMLLVAMPAVTVIYGCIKCTSGNSPDAYTNGGNHDFSEAATLTGTSKIKSKIHSKSAPENSFEVDYVFDGTYSRFDRAIQNVFRKWGRFVFSHPIKVIIASLAVSLGLSMGLLNFQITMNLVALWASPSSEARQNMEYFNKHFGPFYRIQQLIVKPTNRQRFSFTVPVGHEYSNITWGPVFRKDFMLAVLHFQREVENIVVRHDNMIIDLKDICLSPLKPVNNECAIQSIFGFLQNNASRLEDEVSYLSHMKSCSMNPREPKCFASYGGHIDSTEVVLGGYEENRYDTAEVLIITIPVINHYENDKNNDALLWEKEFLNFMENFSHPLMNISYKAERSIEDELDRMSRSDVLPVGVSYAIMLCYITLALGEYRGCRTFLIDAQFTLGFAGVMIVLLSVTASLGAFSFAGVSATLVIIEVIPFLVLAVGVDNIFILVQAFQRDKRRENETLDGQMCRIVGDVAPSLMLSSLSMSSCFFIGTLTEMPAVKLFALYAGVALLINFFLQMTCFLALFSLDRKRHASSKLDVCCCIRASKSQRNKEVAGCFQNLFSNIYAPFLMKDTVRCFVVLGFFAWVLSSIAILDKVHVGLHEELAVPKDSYMVQYFKDLKEYLSVGPPVYFVITDGYDYSKSSLQSKICSSLSFCDPDSVLMQLAWMAQQKNRTYIAYQPIGWLDSYLEFLDSKSCCFTFKANETFCPSRTALKNKGLCKSCHSSDSSTLGYVEFNRRAQYFLQDVPWERCAKSGKATYASAVELIQEDYGIRIGATNFMTYHTILKTSKDFYEALRWSRDISANLTRKLSTVNPDVRVFPYSLVHVFYEQYLTMWPDTLKNLGLSITAVFCVTFLLLGLDLHSALMVVITIIMIIVNLIGLMYWWEISLNALSLVNLVVAVGISVEFCSHLTRSFALSVKRNRILRAQDALCKTGISVLSGITLTDCGILILVFAKSQIFHVYYFRMYLGIIAFGTLHSLIFLPVLLSLIGPASRRCKSRNYEIKNCSQGNEERITIV